MTKYLVHLNPGLRHVIVSLDGYGPTKGEGLTELGSFELGVDQADNQLVDPDAINQKGDHLFVAKAKEVLLQHLGENASTKGYEFLDRATNAVLTDEDADMSTDALRRVDAPGARDAEASAQAGGVKSAATHQIHADTQNDGDKADSPPAVDAANGTEADAGNDGSDGSESVADLKTRIAGITDKAELQKEYEAEQAGKNRSTAIKAIEDRAAELEA